MGRTMRRRAAGRDEPKLVGPSGAVAEEGELDFVTYWKLFNEHKWSVLALAALAGLIGALTAYSLPPVYQAKVSILIEPENPKLISLNPGETAANGDLFYQTQRDIMKSRAVADAIITKLKLEGHPEFEKLGRKGEEEAGTFMGVSLPWMDRTPLSRAEGEARFRRSLVNVVQERLSVGISGESQIVSIGFEAEDPQLAADGANMAVQAYIELGLETRLVAAKQATGWLTKRLAELTEKVTESENARQQFLEQEGIVDSTSAREISSGKLGGITEGLVAAQTKRVEAEIAYNQVEEARRRGSYESLRFIAEQPLVQRLKEEESRLARNVAELAERYGEKHPKRIAASADLEIARKRINVEISKLVEGVRNEYMAAVKNERELARMAEDLKKNLRTEGVKEFQMAKLEREVETNRKLYEMFLTRFKETSATENESVTNVRIIDPAIPPTEAAKPKKGQIIGVSCMLGFLLGILFAYVRENLKRTYANAVELEKGLGIPTLGALPTLKQKKGEISHPEFYALSHPQSHFAEAVNNITTALQFSNLDHPPQVVLVTSSLPGEGKSTLSCNLAAALSRMGKTLLIDLDLRKPGLDHLLKIEMRGGLTHLVSGQSDLAETLFAMKMSNSGSSESRFYLLGSGVLPANPLEFLSAKRFAETMAGLRTQFDYIVIDSAPVLPYSDAITLGHMADEVILVVRAGHTHTDLVKETMRRLTQANIVPLGGVLTQADPESDHGYGGYYYYQREGYADPPKPA
ncbi:MAG: polysaccharide biosynthesis tyrosine autokinase [Nitrospinae bacterium]|nr:polysaccharide biosynthesis tyrosine autokinase [Nitrospinota bacterium]